MCWKEESWGGGCLNGRGQGARKGSGQAQEQPAEARLPQTHVGLLLVSMPPGRLGLDTSPHGLILLHQAL